ncbi:hypothetical protein ACIBEF_06780 [Micromonospora sp. NPDC050795]|uniref:hypothetical protein n=1 Tax=Micromonospora sp. NPDC050795 TaxID=3364282 RepID=UPI003789F102
MPAWTAQSAKSVGLLSCSTSAWLLLSVTAGGAFVGSLLWAWRPMPASRAPLATVWAMVAVGVPLAMTATVQSLSLAAALIALSGLFMGPFAAALFLSRSQLLVVAAFPILAGVAGGVLLRRPRAVEGGHIDAC